MLKYVLIALMLNAAGPEWKAVHGYQSREACEAARLVFRDHDVAAVCTADWPAAGLEQ